MKIQKIIFFFWCGTISEVYKVNYFEKKENNKNENFNNQKYEEEYLNNPIIESILELGFDLKDIIEALEVCGNNKELAINYLCNNQH